MTTRRGDFTQQADAYVQARPGYPRALADRLLAKLPSRSTIAEFGAGTGLWTRELSGRGHRIVATEPNAAMRAHGEARGAADVQWQDGSFEEPGLAASSCDWLVAAQAFHWADPARSLPALARIARPGARLTVLWNNRDLEASELLRFVRDRIEALVPAFDEGYRARDWSQVLTSTGDFIEVEIDEQAHVVSMDRERFANLWRSHHLLNRAAGPEAMRGLLSEIERWIDEKGLGSAPLDIPYRCRAFSATVATREGGDRCRLSGS